MNLVAAVQAVLTPDLLRPVYRRRVEAGADPMTGHCYVAAEALYHLLGGAEAGWFHYWTTHEGGPHHWLKNRITGEIIDPTASQFRTAVPYDQGTCSGWLTSKPSKRAAEVMRRVGGGA